ncbi:hypothetical protein [Nonomuraea glycinis]|uniref:hypothetical protein n=1 Tax=Nonomuraea glycinis TaxID=2047744 RepID=UPI002E153515|nr:hypothetical protein OHA68_27465 [Nonomuraea glycinis]
MEVDVGDQNNAEKKSTPADSDTKSSPAGSDKQSSAIIVAIIGAVATIAVAVITVVVPILTEDPAPPTTTPSPSRSPSATPPPPTAPSPSSPPLTKSGQPVGLSVEPAGRRAVAVTATLNRPARSGYAYWFVLEVHQVSDTHSEFYPRQSLTQKETTFEISIPGDADISRPRTGRVFEVTEDMSKLMESGRPDAGDPNADFLLRQPCTCHASKEIALDFPS